MTAVLAVVWMVVVGTVALAVRHRAIHRAMRDHPELRTHR